MELATKRRTRALQEMTEKMEFSLQNLKEDGYNQRLTLQTICRLASQAEVPPIEWLQSFFLQSQKKESIKDTFFCEGCENTFDSIYAFNGHGPKKCKNSRQRTATKKAH